MVSSDGKQAAFLSDRTVTLSALNNSDTVSAGIGLASADGFGDGGKSPLLQWGTDSQSIWTSKRDMARPSGFSLSGLKPLRIFSTGKIENLPLLEHPAGSLDKLLWINDKGLGFAVFGTYSGYSPPRPAAPNAAFAIVDAAHGIILDSFPVSEIAREMKQKSPSLDEPGIKNVALAILPDGRARVLFRIPGLREWILWTQNEKPRVLKHRYMDLSDIGLTLSPDGEKVLVFQHLRTEGEMIIETWAKGSRVHSPGKPVMGRIASLYDFNTGEELWSLSATVAKSPSGAPPVPVISQDGRFALIRIPADTEDASIALVSMLDGKILQRLPIQTETDSSSYAMGFTEQGVWTRTYNLTVLYSFKPHI